jgi:hypothetical protein
MTFPESFQVLHQNAPFCTLLLEIFKIRLWRPTMNKKNSIVVAYALITASSFGWATPIKQEVKPVTLPEKSAKPMGPKTTPIETKKSKQLKIEAHIDPKELGYKKFFSTYYPDTLKIRANGKEVYALTNKDKVESKEITIPVNGNKVTIEYDYEWDMITGKRTGTKRVEFDVNDKANKLELEFGSWKEDNRIVIPQAKQIGDEQKVK